MFGFPQAHGVRGLVLNDEVLMQHDCSLNDDSENDTPSESKLKAMEQEVSDCLHIHRSSIFVLVYNRYGSIGSLKRLICVHIIPLFLRNALGSETALTKKMTRIQSKITRTVSLQTEFWAYLKRYHSKDVLNSSLWPSKAYHSTHFYC